MASPEFTYEFSKSLRAKLLERMPSIEEGYDDFPNLNQKIKMPCFSLFVGTPVFVPGQPYVVSKGTKITDEEDPNFGKTPVRRCIGQYELNMQIDFWCGSKRERHKIAEEFSIAMNDLNPTPGMNLKVDSYYGEYIHLHMEDVPMDFDTGEAAQTLEFRLKGQIVGTARRIVEKMEYLMENIENNLETTEEELPEEPSGTVTVSI